MKRRDFLKHSALLTAGLSLPMLGAACTRRAGGAAGLVSTQGLFFDISLAQWSHHKAFFGEALVKGWEYMNAMFDSDPDAVLAGPVKPVDFPRISRQEYGIDAVEYVSIFYYGHTVESPVIRQLAQTSKDEGVRNVLIMVDREGALGDADPAKRTKAVENHQRWIEIAAYLGCHSIRVNAESSGSWEEQKERAADGLSRLSANAAKEGLNVIVENHGGLSSNGEWLSSVIASVNMDNCGTLPDFGNFRIREGETYDTYLGVEQLMPYAKGVSAKSYDFDAEGDETSLDYARLLRIVKDAGYTGHIGVEYEGGRLSEAEGIRATRDLLIRLGRELS